MLHAYHPRHPVSLCSRLGFPRHCCVCDKREWTDADVLCYSTFIHPPSLPGPPPTSPPSSSCPHTWMAWHNTTSHIFIRRNLRREGARSARATHMMLSSSSKVLAQVLEGFEEDIIYQPTLVENDEPQSCAIIISPESTRARTRLAPLLAPSPPSPPHLRQQMCQE